MKEIIINTKKYGIQRILVDDENYTWLNQFKWEIRYKNGIPKYAVTKVELSKNIKSQVQMHRLIMGCVKGDGKIIDHKDRNGFNNQVSNLRFCTKAQNAMNKDSRPGSSSKYLGVFFYRKERKYKSKKTGEISRYKNSGWAAVIKSREKNIYLGHFALEEDAARAYDAAAKIYHGEFANLNFKS